MCVLDFMFYGLCLRFGIFAFGVREYALKIKLLEVGFVPKFYDVEFTFYILRINILCLSFYALVLMHCVLDFKV